MPTSPLPSDLQRVPSQRATHPRRPDPGGRISSSGGVRPGRNLGTRARQAATHGGRLERGPRRSQVCPDLSRRRAADFESCGGSGGGSRLSPRPPPRRRGGGGGDVRAPPGPARGLRGGIRGRSPPPGPGRRRRRAGRLAVRRLLTCRRRRASRAAWAPLSLRPLAIPAPSTGDPRAPAARPSPALSPSSPLRRGSHARSCR